MVKSKKMSKCPICGKKYDASLYKIGYSPCCGNWMIN